MPGLNEHRFVSVTEAQRIIEAWRIDCNALRPQYSLCQQTSLFSDSHFQKPTLLQLIEELLRVLIGDFRQHTPGAKAVQDVEQGGRELRDARGASQRVGDNGEVDGRGGGCRRHGGRVPLEEGAHVKATPAEVDVQSAADGHGARGGA